MPQRVAHIAPKIITNMSLKQLPRKFNLFSKLKKTIQKTTTIKNKSPQTITMLKISETSLALVPS